MFREELPVALVASDRACRGLSLAEEHGVPGVLLERTDFSAEFDRDVYASEMASAPVMVRYNPGALGTGSR